MEKWDFKYENYYYAAIALEELTGFRISSFKNSNKCDVNNELGDLNFWNARFSTDRMSKIEQKKEFKS